MALSREEAEHREHEQAEAEAEELAEAEVEGPAQEAVKLRARTAEQEVPEGEARPRAPEGLTRLHLLRPTLRALAFDTEELGGQGRRARDRVRQSVADARTTS